MEYCKISFLFFKHEKPFFHLTKKARKYKYLTLKCLFGGHGDSSTKFFGDHKHCYDDQ